MWRGAGSATSYGVERYFVRPGDCVASLASRHGVTVREIWDHPDNQQLRERRSSPYLLRPGDEIVLPPPDEPPARISPGGTQRFRGQPPQLRLLLELTDEQFEEGDAGGEHERDDRGARSRAADAAAPPRVDALAGVPYRLVAGGRRIEGTTDGQGRIDERIDARLHRVRLTLEPDTEHERTLEVLVGHLDPGDEDSGLVHRLSNLGFPCSLEEGAAAAIAAFQRSRHLTVTGDIDDETRRALLDESGG
jgi:hypothetical protein